MQYRDISFPTPQENIAFDDVLLEMAEKHQAGGYLRFWESGRVFVVLGLSGREDMDVNTAQAQKDGIPVLRRSSGGGTVVQGPGCLNYTLVISKQKHPEVNDLHKSYEWISTRLIEALRGAGVQAYFRPLSDLAVGDDEKKFSGNAQRRRKTHILHHGTILYKFDLGLISRYLKQPREIPEYRRGRPHADFVTNIPVDPRIFKTSLAKVFHTLPVQPPSAQELSLLKQKR